MSLRHFMASPIPPRRGERVLVATCECLAVSGALPALERRNAEDELAKSVYGEVSAPESELLALVHTMLNRGLVAEGELASRMRTVRTRLEAA